MEEKIKREKEKLLRMKMLCEEIGNFFGEYKEEDGFVSVSIDGMTCGYSSYQRMLEDWVDTLVESHAGGGSDWEREILFICFDVLYKKPMGVRRITGKRHDSWYASVDITNPNYPHGKNLHLGTYASIVDAICARKDFLWYDLKDVDTKTDEGLEIAKRRAKARADAAKARRWARNDKEESYTSRF